ncbi:hypothetical protein [Haloprofundus salilacus]|uniref:hypothetical protein n=1 Tax=Haloprofundus salilacus TaxID=2876190 RepID=UPI001CCE11B8|nr:hypothetical protein [Haloprofundus salilacus]
MIRTLLERARTPEYTGENRCIPCTAVNVALAGAAALALVVVSPPVAALALGVSLTLVYLRGYLVPGTPALTKRYLPDWFLRRFDKPPRARTSSVDNPPNDLSSNESSPNSHSPPDSAAFDPATFDAEAFLFEVNALRYGDDDVLLDASFERAWYRRIDVIREGDGGVGQLAKTLGVDAERVSLSDHGNAVAAWFDDDWLGQWESREAFAADMAASAELADRSDVWRRLSVDVRGQVLSGLRACVERCPACGGSVELGERTVESCCRNYDVIAATCTHCDVRYFEAEYDAVDGAFVD